MIGSISKPQTAVVSEKKAVQFAIPPQDEGWVGRSLCFLSGVFLQQLIGNERSHKEGNLQ